jgi:AcrR family transcriptional regulator
VSEEPALIWERPEPLSRPTPSPLSREAIVRAAIGLADADGLVAVSLRKVGAVLDAGPMRLYGYLSTKEELLDLMVDEVYGEIPLPGPDAGDWRAKLADISVRTRAVARRHEWFTELLSGRPQLGPNALAHLEAGLAAFEGVPGFANIDRALRAYGTVRGYVIGSISAELAERRAERASGLDEQQWQARSTPYLLRMLETGRYPNLYRVVAEAEHPDGATGFLAGLNYVLDGIAANIPG